MPRVSVRITPRSPKSPKKSTNTTNTEQPKNGGQRHGGAMRQTTKEAAFIRKATAMIEEGNWKEVTSMADLEENIAQDEELAKMVDKYSHEVFHDAAMLPAVALMNDGKFDELSENDVQELFFCLDIDGDGYLGFDELELLLKEVIDPPCTDEQIEAIYHATDKNSDQTVSPGELHRALLGPVKDHLKILQKENWIRKQFQEEFGTNVDIPRELMVERVKWSHERDDSFRSLPFSIIYICIFIVIVVFHLNIQDRQHLEKGLENWIDNYHGKLLGPYLVEVGDIDSMFEWLEDSGIPAIFSQCENGTAGLVLCQVAPRSVMIGDAVLKQSRRDGSEQHVWLLQTYSALEHLRLNPGDFLGAGHASVRNVSSSGWAGEGTMDIKLSFATYTERAELFALTHVKAAFDNYGVVLPKADAWAVGVMPYPIPMVGKIVYFMFDAVYVLFLLIPMYQEMRDLFHKIRLMGVRNGIVGYMGFWNFVDWVSILTGFGSIVGWYFCCEAMSANSIQGLLKEDGEKMVLTGTPVMDLPVDAVEKLHKDLDSTVGLFSTLRITMGLTACSVLMKIFKAFQANPRLELVTNTMVKAGSDMVHFSIVFFAVFVGYAVTGHILFGKDLTQFRTFASSLDTCYTVLMLDFAWYVEVSESNKGLDSGMPYIVMAVWFWSYMVFVVLTLLNMLLAIILIHYAELVTQIKLDIDVPSLFTQAYRYFHHAKETKGHMSTGHLAVLLEDNMCHYQEFVAENTLMHAFPNMQRDQADWLVKWLRAEAKKNLQEKDDETFARIKVLAELIENLSKEVHFIKLNSAICSSQLKHEELAGDPTSTLVGEPSHSYFVPLVGNDVEEQVDMLVLQIGGVARELKGRMEAATKELANQSMNVQTAVSGPQLEETMPAMRTPSRPVCSEICMATHVKVARPEETFFSRIAF